MSRVVVEVFFAVVKMSILMKISTDTPYLSDLSLQAKQAAGKTLLIFR